MRSSAAHHVFGQNTNGKVALITGITGQDGAYLAALLLQKGYRVVGMRQPSSVPDLQRIQALLGCFPARFTLVYGDMADATSLYRILSDIRPDEIYNLAAQTHVHVSFDTPEYSGDVNGLGVVRLLEAIKTLGLVEKTRFYQASTSELFGNAPAPQHEQTPLQPVSPYAAGKLYGYWITRTYREAYGMHANNGIMFNHESPLRGEEFVTRKITMAVAAIEAGVQPCLYLGNLDAKRDWSHAKDVVDMIWRILQQPVADDYVVASGVAHTVREFTQLAFAEIGVELVWQGDAVQEKGIDRKTGRVLVQIDPAFYRPNEVHHLCGDSSKARMVLGWKPSFTLSDLVKDMVDSDRESLHQAEGTAHGLRAYG